MFKPLKISYINLYLLVFSRTIEISDNYSKSLELESEFK